MLSLRWRDLYATPTNITNELESIVAQFKALWLTEHAEDGTHLTRERLLDFVPVGAITAYGGATPPSGWVLCDGSQVNRLTYQNLFNLIGTTYGAGDGSTTFNVPDLRQRFLLGKAASGTGNTLGATGGAIDHDHSIASHTHDAGTLAVDSHSHSAGTLAGPSHTHTGPSHSHSISTQAAHTHTVSGDTAIHQESMTWITVDRNLDGATVSVLDSFAGGEFISVGHTHADGTLAADSGGSHDHGGSTGSGGTGNTGSSGTGSVTGSTGSASPGLTGNTGSASGTSGTANPPYAVVNYIIFTGVAV